MNTESKTIIDFVESLAKRTQEWESTLVQLTPRYQARWDFAVHMYSKHILKAMLDPSVIVIFDNYILDDSARLSINMHRKEIKLIDATISYILFNGNPEHDEGAHDTLTKIEKDIKENFILCKKIEW